MATSVAGPTHPSRLFHIYYRNSNTRFLVDTGAKVSVIPSTRIDRSHSPSPCFLQGVDGSQIATYGVRSCTLNIGLRRTFRWVFTIANVKQAILGADFLHHFGLVVDMRRRALLDSNTHLSIHGILSDPSSSSPSIIRLQLDSTDPYLTLLSQFPALTQPCAADRPIKHDVVHHIETTGGPVSARIRHLAPERLRIARDEFDHMMELGIVRPLSSSWASPLHVVPKRTPGDWRPCRDFRALNKVTLPCASPAGFFRCLRRNNHFLAH